MDYISAHVPQAVRLAYPTYFAISPSSRLAILLTGLFLVVAFANNKSFELNDVCQRRMEETTIVGRGWEISSTAIPTLHGNSFRGLSIAWVKGSPLVNSPLPVT
jgi:hypothetical protein